MTLKKDMANDAELAEENAHISHIGYCKMHDRIWG
jgi:hypothetical protein